MTLHDWLAKISQCHTQEIDLTLARSRRVAERLKVLKFSCPVFVVGGTNGKGSCTTTISSILSQAGYRVGRYNSPHLVHFNERININEQPVDDTLICQAFARVFAAREDTPLTYFECVTLAALVIFQDANLDALVLEVGMGGRFDAVNLIDNDVAVLTTVDLDHQAWLGDTREQIGAEKAGIFRPGKTVICAERNPPASVLAAAQACHLLRLGVDVDYQRHSDHLYCPQYDLSLALPKLHPDNVMAAIMAIKQVPQLAVTNGQIAIAAASAQVPGRLQVVPGEITHLLDVSHNAQSIALLKDYLAAHEQPTIAVWSMLEDKPLADTVAQLSPYIEQWVTAPLQATRAAARTDLEASLRQQACRFHSAADIASAYRLALGLCSAQHRLLVCGSFHTVAEVMNTGIMQQDLDVE